MGTATNGLCPDITARKTGGDWVFDLEYQAMTNFSKRAWLRITNHVGSRLELRTEDGSQVQSGNADVTNAFDLPSEAAVKDILEGVAWRARTGQWLRTSVNGSSPGELANAAHFTLSSAYNVSATNTLVLTITPLLYKVDAEQELAHLTEFPPIKMRLLTNGSIEVMAGTGQIKPQTKDAP